MWEMFDWPSRTFVVKIETPWECHHNPYQEMSCGNRNSHGTAIVKNGKCFFFEINVQQCFINRCSVLWSHVVTQRSTVASQLSLCFSDDQLIWLQNTTDDYRVPRISRFVLQAAQAAHIPQPLALGTLVDLVEPLLLREVAVISGPLPMLWDTCALDGMVATFLGALTSLTLWDFGSSKDWVPRNHCVLVIIIITTEKSYPAKVTNSWNGN